MTQSIVFNYLSREKYSIQQLIPVHTVAAVAKQQNFNYLCKFYRRA